MKRLLMMFLVPLLFSCGGNTKSEEKEKIPIHYYTEVKDKMIDFFDSFKQKENKYYVYCYSNVCEYCEEIRNEVIHIALKNTKTIYFCSNNVTKKDLDPQATIGCKDINDLFIRGFPSLIEITDLTVTNNFLGKNKVIETLRK